MRTLDAAANRAAEAIRTLEDLARFALNDPLLSRSLKQHRHRLRKTLAQIDRDQRLLVRDVAGDVGTRISTATETQRADLNSIAAAAGSRSAEALRTVEELMKTISAESATQVESIRYAMYSLAAQIEQRLRPSDRRDRLMRSQIYVLVDVGPDDAGFAERVSSLIEAGVDVIQLRDKTVDDRTLLERATRLVELAGSSDTLTIVNDRADITMAANADGVHVGQEELPVAAVRKLIGFERLLGLSTHNTEQATAPETSHVDYIGCGPIFPSSTKAFDRVTGPEWLGEVASQTGRPAFAIGGITLENVDQISARGIRRVAVTASLGRAVKDLPEIVGRFRQSLGELATLEAGG